MQNKTSISKDQIKTLMGEDRYKEPLEIHKFIVTHLLKDLPSSDVVGSFLDIGCGVGEFIYYAKQILTNFKFTGIDISGEVLERASDKMPDVIFKNISVFDMFAGKHKNQYDIVTMCGALGFFDDVYNGIVDLLNLVKKNGSLYIFGPFNNDPVDVITRYSLSDDQELKSGWNIFSKRTCEKIISSIKGTVVKWHDFKIKFGIEKRPDNFMRSWTVQMHDNPFQLVNGACQIIDLSLMTIKKY